MSLGPQQRYLTVVYKFPSVEASPERNPGYLNRPLFSRRGEPMLTRPTPNTQFDRVPAMAVLPANDKLAHNPADASLTAESTPEANICRHRFPFSNFRYF